MADYTYMVENKGISDSKDNSKLIRLISELNLDEDKIFIEDDDNNKTELCSLLEDIDIGDRLVILSVEDLV